MQALEHDAKKGGNKRIVALGHIVAMQKLLQAYRAEEISKLSYYSWTVGSKPRLITQEIDPALKHITKALKDLKVSTSEYSVAAIAAVSILATAAGIGLWFIGSEGRDKLLKGENPFVRSEVPEIPVKKVTRREAQQIAKIFKRENADSINHDLLEQAKKLGDNQSDIHSFYRKDQDHARALLCAINLEDKSNFNILSICETETIIYIVQKAGLGKEYLNSHALEPQDFSNTATIAG